MAPSMILKDSVLKKNRTDSVVKKVHFKLLPSNDVVGSCYGIKMYMFSKEVTPCNTETKKKCRLQTEHDCLTPLKKLEQEKQEPDVSPLKKHEQEKQEPDVSPLKMLEYEKQELEVSPLQDEFEVEAILDHTKVPGFIE